MTVLSKNLKRFRQAKQLTQEAAAEALDVSTQSVSRWECDSTLPDATLLPKIACLYGCTIDDLFKENSVDYENYAQMLGGVYEGTRDPADFLRADREYRKLLRCDTFSADDLRMYAILHQYMMQYCMEKADDLFEKGLKKAEDTEMYWRIKRQQIAYRNDIGRGQEAVAEFLPAVKADSDDLQVWICLIHAYCATEDAENALLWAERAEKKFPENAMLHIYMGNIFRRLAQYDKAFFHWKRAQQLEPTWMDSAYSMAECYEARIQSEAQACARITNADLVCADCTFVLPDDKIYGNTSRCKKFRSKPNAVLSGRNCDEYQPKR